MGINLFRVLITYLKPILPTMTEASEQFLQCETLTWDNINQPLLNHTIQTFTPLIVRVEPDKIAAMLGDAKGG
jgi:methionyl-tRNA synthetase